MSAPDPTTFPDPERFATYIMHRSPKFKTHKHLGMAKNAIAAKASHGRNRVTKCDSWVYEFDFEAGLWREVAHIPSGTLLDTDPWYSVKQSSKPASLGPSEGSIDAAIASIVGAAQND